MTRAWVEDLAVFNRRRIRIGPRGGYEDFNLVAIADDTRLDIDVAAARDMRVLPGGDRYGGNYCSCGGRGVCGWCLHQGLR